MAELFRVIGIAVLTYLWFVNLNEIGVATLSTGRDHNSRIHNLKENDIIHHFNSDSLLSTVESITGRAAKCYVDGQKYEHGQMVNRESQYEDCICINGETFCWWKPGAGRITPTMSTANAKLAHSTRDKLHNIPKLPLNILNFPMNLPVHLSEKELIKESDGSISMDQVHPLPTKPAEAGELTVIPEGISTRPNMVNADIENIPLAQESFVNKLRDNFINEIMPLNSIEKAIKMDNPPPPPTLILDTFSSALTESDNDEDDYGTIDIGSTIAGGTVVTPLSSVGYGFISRVLIPNDARHFSRSIDDTNFAPRTLPTHEVTTKHCIILGQSYPVGTMIPQSNDNNCLQCFCIAETSDQPPRVSCTPRNCSPLILPDLLEIPGNNY